MTVQMYIGLQCGSLESYMCVPTLWKLLSITGIFFGNSHHNMGTSHQISSIFLSFKVNVIFLRQFKVILKFK